MLSVNDRVATLLDRNWIDVRMTLSDEQYGRIAGSDGKLLGRKVDVAWKLGTRAVPYTATIDRVAPRITSDTGGIEVIARIDDPTVPMPLRPGAFVEVRIPDTLYENVIAIPPTALFDGNIVYAVVNARLQPKRVERVGSHGDLILVKGELKTGDEVLTTRVSTPGAGVLVRVVKQP